VSAGDGLDNVEKEKKCLECAIFWDIVQCCRYVSRRLHLKSVLADFQAHFQGAPIAFQCPVLSKETATICVLNN
jgi:hypothetical protein